ncbi:MAG: transcription antitermination factor NusB [Sporolactobacillus sp.]
MNRREARQIALQVLFQVSLSGTDRQTAVDAVYEGIEPLDPFVNQLLDKTLQNEEKIDQLINGHLKNWSLKRLGNIDKTILRLAVCELIYFNEIPSTVSINEAVELCRTYSDDKTRIFVNGVLSSIAKELAH